jgi:cell division protein FtsW (lipid II flippase)
MTALPLARRERAASGHVRELDWLMLVVVALCCLGLVMAVSIRGSQAGQDGPMSVMRSQGVKLLAGLLLFLFASIVPMAMVRRWALPGFAAMTLACLLPLLQGKAVNGAYRWIELGSMTLQPVEPARFFLVLTMAWLLARSGAAIHTFRGGFVPAMGCAMALVGALACQPDNGNALIILGLASAMALVAGVRFLFFMPVGVAGLALLSYAAMQHEYVRSRVAALFELRPNGQVGLGLIAVGSGGLFGRGIGQGWMKMNYVPEAHNDFVFAIIAEELGFCGSLFVLAGFATFGYVCYRLAIATKDPFLRYVVCGYSLMICMQAGANLLVVSGWAPAKGIDLPFVSTGGTSLMFCLAAVGLIGNAVRTDRSGAFVGAGQAAA